MSFDPKRFLSRLSKAIDAFGMQRVRAAVPDSGLRRAGSDIKRLRRLLHARPAATSGR
jgi:hypothetical protein